MGQIFAAKPDNKPEVKSLFTSPPTQTNPSETPKPNVSLSIATKPEEKKEE